ncbi:hypothetical protein AX769_17600 [Frondihabitans sp. PAMC 28766]|uniref:N-acetylglucosamine-6-phosphate deacetylase n=1 Tax=Frondihabitans sp. PAMC 28766 TaxID=1795630 RepID=UPI00078EA806|nr:amidohydrolase family protein [Frondihabitans sp. PAMC 28766]AMM21622.1 hypothetical protein AX769_17600 [Frondihabitans sp. PAMC 28766]
MTDSAPSRRIVAADRIVDGTIDWSPGWLEIRHGVIVARGAGLPVGENAERIQGILLPGFVDLHCHGALSADFARAPTEDAMTATQHHRARGTTTLIASVATGTPADTLDAVGRLVPLVKREEIAGIHLEGPFLSSRRRGAHAADLLRPPDRSEMDALLEEADGAISVVTLAPELPGALGLITHLVANGVIVAIGHTDCDAETASRALDRGATLMTHLFNGMPPLHHRRPGPVGIGLTDRRAVLELIADGHHLAEPILRLALESAAGRAVLVSDAMAATGCADGPYEIAGSEVTVSGGVATLTDGSSLAGSTITILDALHHVLRETRVTIQEAVRLSSESAARMLGREARGFAVGAAADAVLLPQQPDGSAVAVMKRGLWL